MVETNSSVNLIYSQQMFLSYRNTAVVKYDFKGLNTTQRLYDLVSASSNFKSLSLPSVKVVCFRYAFIQCLTKLSVFDGPSHEL